MSQNTPVSSKFNKLSIDIYLIYIFLNFQYFWTKTFWDSYTSIQQIFSNLTMVTVNLMRLYLDM